MNNNRDCIEMIRQLVAAPSASSALPQLDQSNKQVINLLAEWLAAQDFEIDIVAIDACEKYNLMARKGHGQGGLVLSGHTDTVPADTGLWRYDPLQLTAHNGRLYGLGSCDMKSFFALAIEASKPFSATQLKEPLIILATADEESTMSGARVLAESGGLRARSAIIGEPTGNIPVRMHKGVMMERILITGQSGHSSDPMLGRNALDGLHKVMGELMRFREDLQSRWRDEMFHVPAPTLNLGRVHGGDSPNRICGHCYLDIDLRLLPGMGIEVIRNSMQERLQQCLHGSGLKLDFSSLFHGMPAMETRANSELVKLTETLTGHRAEAVAFATEGPYLQSLGMDVVIMGPGQIELAHQPDEYLEISTIEPTIALLQQLIYKHCVVGH